MKPLYILFIGIVLALCFSLSVSFKFADVKKFFHKDVKKFFQKDAKKFFEKDAKKFFDNAGKKTKAHFQDAWKNYVQETKDLTSGKTLRLFKTNPVAALHKLHKLNPVISFQGLYTILYHLAY